MSENKVTWKNYLLTSVGSGVAVAVSHLLATKANCSVADHWATIGLAGSVGSLAGSYLSQNGFPKKN